MQSLKVETDSKNKLIKQTEIMKNEWVYIGYNYDTEMYDVLKQVRGIKNDEVLKSFKRKGNAQNYELKINFNI